ncbi:MAG: helix-turn-helix transcriptional regulator [Bacteroidota bacterium]|jgi:transcriptional regulator with XRE-family HTH domain|nr:helix-turn-helix transcriptional regulator [Bacteroidota bacterium]HHU97192.1 helix-turn-helix transcriptional regulator [Petrimonas sp.]
MDISTVINQAPESISKELARRVKSLRLERNLTQQAFAKRAGVGYDAYRRFENRGEITLKNLLLCAVVLDCLDDFNRLFARKSYESIDQLLQANQIKQRKRGTINE